MTAGPTGRAPDHWSSEVGAADEVALVDLIDRLIDGGVVVGGDIVLSIAGVDLVYLGLRLVLTPAHTVDLAGVGKGTGR